MIWNHVSSRPTCRQVWIGKNSTIPMNSNDEGGYTKTQLWSAQESDVQLPDLHGNTTFKHTFETNATVNFFFKHKIFQCSNQIKDFIVTFLITTYIRMYFKLTVKWSRGKKKSELTIQRSERKKSSFVFCFTKLVNCLYLWNQLINSLGLSATTSRKLKM